MLNELQNDKSDKDALTDQWRIVFFITAGMYVMGSVVYWFLGSAEVQEWSKFDVAELPATVDSDEQTHTNDKVNKSQ